MTKHILFPIVLVLVFIAVVGFYLNKTAGKGFIIGNTASETVPPEEKKEVIVSGKTIQVEVADTNEERTEGLSERSALDPDQGMLFVFDSSDVTPSFWMKDMNFAIDIVWINDGKIVQIDKSAKVEAGILDSKLTLYTPKEAVDYVLELNAGFCNKYAIKVGDSVDLSKI